MNTATWRDARSHQQRNHWATMGETTGRASHLQLHQHSAMAKPGTCYTCLIDMSWGSWVLGNRLLSVLLSTLIALPPRMDLVQQVSSVFQKFMLHCFILWKTSTGTCFQWLKENQRGFSLLWKKAQTVSSVYSATSIIKTAAPWATRVASPSHFPEPHSASPHPAPELWAVSGRLQVVSPCASLSKLCPRGPEKPKRARKGVELSVKLGRKCFDWSEWSQDTASTALACVYHSYCLHTETKNLESCCQYCWFC